MMTLLAILFAALGALGIANALWYSSRPERNALTESDLKQAIERRIDMSYTLTLTSMGACLTLASVAANGPLWTSVLGLLMATITMPLLRRLRPEQHQPSARRVPASAAHAKRAI